ncbi:hypothetical protein GC176_26505 [bacterium]|nr:hypothetical protein [bacterium]
MKYPKEQDIRHAFAASQPGHAALPQSSGTSNLMMNGSARRLQTAVEMGTLLRGVEAASRRIFTWERFRSGFQFEGLTF